jgi:ergothioneine biosynthesis protein EgtB
MISSKPPHPFPIAAAIERSPLAERYQRVREMSLALAAPLTAEDCQVQSMADASPTKWHLAHVTWFFETFLLERYEACFAPFDASFRVLFNSYYQGVGDRYPRPGRGLITRPTLDDVKRYRRNVDERVQALLTTPTTDTARDEIITLGLHHEQQHQELLLTDIKHAFSFDPNARAYARRWPMTRVRPQALRWFHHDGGLVEHGHDGALDGAFCFDNETPRHRTFLAPFEIASRPVSYGDYLSFMEDGGYRRPELWLSMGWDWVTAGARRAPLYWREAEGRWLNHTLQGLVEIDPRTPVCHLSYFEADAYARWAAARLPTEPNGNSRRAGCASRSAATSRTAAVSTRSRTPIRTSTAASRCRCTAMSGNGRSRATHRTRAIGRCRVRSASTTASSCATSTCCAAARVRRRRATCARATATSSRLMRSGSSAACGWRATPLRPEGPQRSLQRAQEFRTSSTSERNSRR